MPASLHDGESADFRLTTVELDRSRARTTGGGSACTPPSWTSSVRSLRAGAWGENERSALQEGAEVRAPGAFERGDPLASTRRLLHRRARALSESPDLGLDARKVKADPPPGRSKTRLANWLFGAQPLWKGAGSACGRSQRRRDARRATGSSKPDGQREGISRPRSARLVSSRTG